jgi:hypothetical protein
LFCNWRQFLQRLLFGCQIGFKVNMGRFYAFMAEPESDGRNINTCLQQMGGCCVANKMRGNGPREEAGTTWRGILNRLGN